MFTTKKCTTFYGKRTFQSGFRFFLALLLSVAFFWATSCGAKSTTADVETSPVEKVSLEERWGVTVESLRTSANGHLLDFRYRIKDPGKAEPLVDRRNKAYLVDQASGKVLAVPNTAKVGPLRQTVRTGKPKQDRVYFVLFGNPGGMVKSGDTVTVVIGNFRAENLTVE